ncbi:prolipoprotein diacylglyceryl transferase [Candidatus Gracilibacteria bacterium]|nr:prolipoprotein diacylglyceryl transferase [Candidatus Gracilibacteria bacterium]
MHIFSVNLFGITIAPSYYGLMYGLGFIAGYLIIKKRGLLSEVFLDNLTLYIFFGVILGGRIGYILFYNLSFYLQNPSEILKFWHGGMSFFGGAIGVILAMIIFARKYKKSFYDIADNVVTILPIGLGLGRVGNYLNKELLGFEYSGFLAVYKNGIGYFPSPLLEALLEGLVLYFILSFLFKRRKYLGQIGGGFLFFYGIFRFLIEFVRTPDAQIGYIFGWITIAQIMSFPMILVGLYFGLFFKKYPANAK